MNANGQGFAAGNGPDHGHGGTRPCAGPVNRGDRPDRQGATLERLAQVYLHQRSTMTSGPFPYLPSVEVARRNLDRPQGRITFQ